MGIQAQRFCGTVPSALTIAFCLTALTWFPVHISLFRYDYDFLSLGLSLFVNHFWVGFLLGMYRRGWGLTGRGFAEGLGFLFALSSGFFSAFVFYGIGTHYRPNEGIGFLFLDVPGYEVMAPTLPLILIGPLCGLALIEKRSDVFRQLFRGLVGGVTAFTMLLALFYMAFLIALPSVDRHLIRRGGAEAEMALRFGNLVVALFYGPVCGLSTGTALTWKRRPKVAPPSSGQAEATSSA